MNIYAMLKIGSATGNSLYRMGAQMRGETYEEFLATRNISGAPYVNGHGSSAASACRTCRRSARWSTASGSRTRRGSRSFDAYVPVREWLAQLKPDVAIVVYNDHVADFSFDKYPTFALGVGGAATRSATKASARGRCREVAGDAEFSTHLCEALDLRARVRPDACARSSRVEHGFLVPMNLCFPHADDGWPVRACRCR